jgi:uncharacterized protein YodC (DUF2158 family)
MAEVVDLRARDNAAPSAFDVGDLVQLNSGGSVMTVRCSKGGKSPYVECDWHTAGEPYTARYDPAMLRRASHEIPSVLVESA